MSMKKHIAELFGFDTYEIENRILREKYSQTESLYYGLLGIYNNLKKEKDELKCLADAIERENEELRRISAQPIEYIAKETERLEDEYRTCLNDCEAVLREYQSREEDLQIAINRARSEGYKEAFVKMGIKALDSRIKGEQLYFEPSTMEVVKVDSDAQLQTIIDEIQIDDLVDVVAESDGAA